MEMVGGTVLATEHCFEQKRESVRSKLLDLLITLCHISHSPVRQFKEKVMSITLTIVQVENTSV